MKSVLPCLLILALAACAGAPERTAPEPAAPEPTPPAAVEPAEPSVPVPESEAEPEPREEADTSPEVEASAPPEPEPREPAPEAPEPMVADDPVDTLTAESQASNDAGAIHGAVTVLRNNRPMAGAATFLNQTVIAWQPENGAPVSPMDERVITTRSSRFFPQTMAVTSGTSIRFPNRDSIEHNVFSLTPGHRFDVGMYGEGEGVSHRFTGSGVAELFCNIHPNMAAFVLVLDTPFFVTPDADGRFELVGLPEGPGELLVWNYRAEEPFQRIALTLDGRVEAPGISVDITRPAVPQHTNKHGEPYRPR